MNIQKIDSNVGGSLKYLSICYALFITSGMLKALFYWALGGVDITLLFGFLSLLLGARNLKRKIKIFDLALCVLWFFFCLSYLYSSIYSESFKYIQSKYIGLCVNSIAFLIPIFFRISIRHFSMTIFLASFISGVFYLSVKSTLPYGDFSEAYGGAYLTISLFLGISIILFLFIKNRFSILLLTIGFILLVLLGGRSSIILTAFAIFIYFQVGVLRSIKNGCRLNFGRITAVLFLFVIIFVSAYKNYDQWIKPQLDASLYRLELLLSDKKGSSISGRLEYIEIATSMIEDKPVLGYGMAMFPIVYSGVDARLYPHNIFLEIWSETGLVSLVLFILIVLFSFFLSIEKKDRNTQFLIFFIYTYCLMSISKSYGFEDIRFFFCFIIVLKWLGLGNVSKNR